MERSVLAFVDAVGAIGIRHHAEQFVMFNQFIDHHFKVLVVNIVIAGAVNYQQISLQILSVSNR
jgi:hypothetical protein